MKQSTTVHLKACSAALFAAVLAAGCTSENPAERLLREAVSSGRYIYAHQDDLVYGHTWYQEQGRSDVKEVCGDYPLIVGYDLGGIELGSGKNLDGVDFGYMRSTAIEHASRGGIVTLSWHPRNPLTGGDAWDVSSAEVVASIISGGANEELFGLWLKRAADFIDSLRGSDGRLIPIIFRPWHENLGSWFWWGAGLCSEEEYQALWDRTYAYMVEERHLEGMLWAYSPNGDATEEAYMSRYPGDGIIDILGADSYHYGSVEEFQSQLRTVLGYLTPIARQRGKLLALTETGHESIPEADWWTGVLDPAIRDYPICYVLTWRNACDRPEHFYGPFPGATCEDDFKKFHKLNRTIFLSDI